MTNADPIRELDDPTDPRPDVETALESIRGAATRVRDRSYLGRQVVNVSLGIVIVLVLFVLFMPFTTAGGWEAVRVPAEYVLTIISTILLPLVTLVLGHYFGTVERNN